MNRVIVTSCMVGLCHMQVCACKDATDAEILSVCNAENPSGTANGWVSVVRTLEQAPAYPESPEIAAQQLPGPCADNPERLHFLVEC